MSEDDSADIASAASLLDKLRVFAAGLDADERQLLAALLSPGIDAAWDDEIDDVEADDAEDEVAGFTVSWHAGVLPAHLSRAIRGRALRVEGW